MSRTDVHAPNWVKERDPFWREYYKEVHNHGWHCTGHEKYVEDGITRYRPTYRKVERCELDIYLSAREWVRTSCYVTLTSRSRRIDCGCAMCTGRISRKLARKADRSRTKRLLRSERWDDIYGASPSRWRY